MDPSAAARAARAFTPTPPAPAKSQTPGLDAMDPGEPTTAAPPAPTPPPKPPSTTPGLDALDPGEPEPLQTQLAAGVAPSMDRPDIPGDYNDLFNVSKEYAQRLQNGGADADNIAMNVVKSEMRRRNPQDQGAHISPFGVGGVTNAVKSVAPAGSLPYRAAEAFGIKQYGESARAEQEAYWSVARTDSERQLGKVYYENMLRSSGESPDAAKIKAQARYDYGVPLLLPTAANPDTGAGQTNIAQEATAPVLRTGRKQAMVDIASGVMEASTDLSRVGMSAIPHAVMNVLVPGGEIPSPTAKLADLLDKTGTATGTEYARRLRDSLNRGVGVVAGSAEALNRNVIYSTNIDPNAGGVSNALWRAAMANPRKTEGGEKNLYDVLGESAQQVAGAVQSSRERSEEVLANPTPTNVAAVAVGNPADMLQALASPVMGAFTMAAQRPTGEESALGWMFRVPATTLSSFATTWLARAADYSMVHGLGATSHRTHRVPGDPEMTAAQAFLPSFLTGNGLHDQLTTVYNGDALASEAMRFSDTAATIPGLSEEAQRAWLPGGGFRSALVNLAMTGDLGLHLDEAPLHAVGATANAVGFARDFYRFRRGLVPESAGALAGATHYPKATHWFLLRNDPEYAKLWGEAGTEAVKAQANMGATNPVTAMPVDPDAVRLTAARAAMRRLVESGANPAQITPDMPRAPKQVANFIREVATTLRLEPGDVERALAENRPVEPPIAPVTSSPTTEAEAVAAERRSDTDTKAPLARWPDNVSTETDPAMRAAAAMAALAEHMDLPAGTGDGWSRLALQAALSHYDPQTGHFVRFPSVTDASLANLDSAHLDHALGLLKDAEPARIWDNVARMKRGQEIRWADDRIPDRARVRDELLAAHALGRNALTPEAVDHVLAVTDQIAKSMVDKGVIAKADDWYAKVAYSTEEPGGGVGVLGQEGARPATAKELRERLARTNFIPTARVLEILGDQRPEYLDAVAQFILEQRAKVRDGLLTNRDVAKAYIMATASQGSGAMDARAVEQVIGSPLAPEFTVTSKRGQRLVRPEEAMAAWLFSPMGQRALDGIERGVFDEEAWQSAARVRKAFGDDRINNLNVLGDPKKGAANMRNIGEVTAALNAAGGDWKKVESAVTKLNGVATGKSPFIGHLLGFGEMPTLDAREINGWLTGRADIGALTTDRANLARAFSGGIDSPPLARSFMQKIQDRFLALQKRGVPGTDLAPEVFGAIMHHWLWDKLGGTETTHEGVYKAMRLAQDELTGRKGEIDFTTFPTTGRALIRLAHDADVSTLVHENAHLLRRVLPAEHMAPIDEHVTATFGGWNRNAEEWFARQWESIVRTGELAPLDKTPPTLRERLTRAFRYLAQQLASIYQSGVLEAVHPVFDRWIRDFMDLKLPEEKAAPEPAPERVRTRKPGTVVAGEPTVVVPQEGWSPELVKDLEERREAIRAEADPAKKKALVKALIHEAHQYVGEEDAKVRQQRHMKATYHPELVVDALVNTGRRIVEAMSPEEREKASAAYAGKQVVAEPPKPPTKKELLAAGYAIKDGVYTHPEKPERWKWSKDERKMVAVGPERVEPSVEAPIPVEAPAAVEAPTAAEAPTAVSSEPEVPVTPAPPVPLPTEAPLNKAASSYMERLFYGSDLGGSKAAARTVVTRLAEHLAALRGESKPEAPLAYLGEAATIFQERTLAILRDMNDARMKMDASEQRKEAALAAITELRQRTMPREDAPVVVAPRAPDLGDFPAPTPPPTPPEVLAPLQGRTMPRHGSPDVDESGALRTMVDEKGHEYTFRIVKLRIADLFTSHTPLEGGLPAWREGYDKAFQNRVDAFSRIGWIESVARDFNARTGIRPTGDTPTVGCPTVWRDEEGRAVVVAGNGRSLALSELYRRAMRGEEPHRSTLAQIQASVASWCNGLGIEQPKGDEILVRELTNHSYTDAVRFAQNSQGAPSVDMTPTAELLSANTKARNAGITRIQVDTLPTSWTNEAVRAFIDATPDLKDALDKIGVDYAKDEKGLDTLAAVRGILLAVAPESIVHAASGAGDRLLNAVANAGPALAKMATDAQENGAIGAFNPIATVRDGILLYVDSRTAGKKGGAVSDKGMAEYANQRSRQVALVPGAKPIAVSRASLAIAEKLARIMGSAVSDPGSFGTWLSDVQKETLAGTQGGMFSARPPDPAEAFLRAVGAGSDDRFPALHPEAMERARDLACGAIEGALATQPVVTEPPGFDKAREMLEVGVPPDVLAQHRDFTRGISPALPKGAPPDTITPVPDITLTPAAEAKDEGFRMVGASKDISGPATPYGSHMARLRAITLLTPEQLNLALGYAADQKVYNARDFVERAGAMAIAYPEQASSPRGTYHAIGNRIAVHERRVAAVRARTMAVLGDLPSRLLDAVNKRKKGTFTGDLADLPIQMGRADAGRIRTILNALDANGWGNDSLGNHPMRTWAVDEIAEKMTPRDFNTLWGAIADSQSGIAPYRGRTDRYSMAANIVHNLTERPGGLLTTEALDRDATPGQRRLNAVRSALGGALRYVSYYMLASEDVHPDMRSDLRPDYQRIRRKAGQAGSALVEAIELACEKALTPGTPGGMVKVLTDLSDKIPGAQPHISVRPGVEGGRSDLYRLRALLYRDPPEPYGTHTVTRRNPDGTTELVGQAVPHDFSRDSTEGGGTPRPLTAAGLINDLYANSDMVERVLAPPTHRTDPTTIDLLDHLRARTLTPEDALAIHTSLGVALSTAKKLGVEILTAVAGASGDRDAIAKVAASAKKYRGLDLDAYEAFYQGRWGRPAPTPGGVVVDTSVEAMVRSLSKPALLIKTPLWVVDVLMRMNQKVIGEEFVDIALDKNYAYSLGEMAKIGGHQPTDVIDAAYFSEKIRQYVTAEMYGTDFSRRWGVDKDGIAEVEIPMTPDGPDDQQARGAARIVCAQMGLRPDILAVRKGIKGELPVNPLAKAIGSLRDMTPDERLAAATKASFWEDLGNANSYSGRTLYMPSAMQMHLADLFERHAPLAERLAENLADRMKIRDFYERMQDVYRQLKGSYVTGGPNGWIGAAAFAGGLAAGATVGGAASLGVAAWALSFTPRMAGYVNNALGAMMQGALELGYRGAAAALNPLGDPVRMAYRASMETVRYHQMGKAVEAARNAVLSLIPGNTPAENVAVLSRDGRIYAVPDIVRLAQEYGLDGTQARFEAAERVQRTMDRLYKRYESESSFTGGMFRQLDAFFGRYRLTENYRRMYEHVDTFFRYVWLMRGLQEGLSPDDAVQRALRISFDYTSTSAFDRDVNQIFMFWMYQRRAVDLLLSSLIERPHAVLGLMRFTRDQGLAAGYAATDDQYNRLEEVESDQVLGRPATSFLPTAGGVTWAQKKMLTEPPSVTALKVLDDASTLNVAGIGARANPLVQVGYNLYSTSVGGPTYNFFQRRVQGEGPTDWRVPMRLVQFDQAVLGGKLTETLDLLPRDVRDPQSAGGGPGYEFYVGPNGRATWQILLSLVPNMSNLVTMLDVNDRGDTAMDDVTLDYMHILHAADIGVQEQLRPDSVLTPAADLHARPALGSKNEALRTVGVGFGAVQMPHTVVEQREREADAAVKQQIAAKQKAIQASQPILTPATQPVGVVPINPNGLKPIDPNAPIGIESKPKPAPR